MNIFRIPARGRFTLPCLLLMLALPALPACSGHLDDCVQCYAPFSQEVRSEKNLLDTWLAPDGTFVGAIHLPDGQRETYYRQLNPGAVRPDWDRACNQVHEECRGDCFSR